ncbi:hypothetical protein BY457_12715 [Marinilabilia salmonicolor]|jgi:transcriptional regulator with XRE-family HTH domain|uniref:hypothetical protein n=1 Tax=Marinilabilia salmonicolor TaxID=989 RepID=UPI000D06224E|nr:hypothetical protein [Marinilabilia salmonicolor]PRY90332.1 hypothetical protein BY457_12715 [Marinilabilia salmonicolor]
MSGLTDKQYKTRWGEIKKVLKERPLLAYKVNIPLEEWDTYMFSYPSHQEIDRIYDEIMTDRKEKTLRVKEGLSKIVGYRESKEFSRRSGVSDSSIRQILDGKKERAGYDIINRLELFLSVTMEEFEPSPENPLSVREFAQNSIAYIASQLNKVAENLKGYCFDLTEMVRKENKRFDFFGERISPSIRIERNIERLKEIKDGIDMLWENYIDGNEKKKVK